MCVQFTHMLTCILLYRIPSYWIVAVFFQSDALAAGLLTLGLRKGDRVGIWGPNSYEWILTQYATARAGLILVNIGFNVHIGTYSTVNYLSHHMNYHWTLNFKQGCKLLPHLAIRSFCSWTRQPITCKYCHYKSDLFDKIYNLQTIIL